MVLSILVERWVSYLCQVVPPVCKTSTVLNHEEMMQYWSAVRGATCYFQGDAVCSQHLTPLKVFSLDMQSLLSGIPRILAGSPSPNNSTNITQHRKPVLQPQLPETHSPGVHTWPPASCCSGSKVISLWVCIKLIPSHEAKAGTAHQGRLILV